MTRLGIHEALMECTIQAAGLCEGCPEGVEALERARGFDRLNPPTVISEGVAIDWHAIAQEAFGYDVGQINQLGERNREKPCEGGLKPNQLHRHAEEISREGYTDAELAARTAAIINLRQIAARAGIDLNPRYRCELKQRGIKEMRDELFPSDEADDE